MIIPPWVYAAGAGLTFLAGAGLGWTVRDWKADSDQLKAVEEALKVERELRDRLQASAEDYEGEKTDAQTQTIIRQGEIRTIYQDREVPGDCAAPDATRGVLTRSVATANARASGEPEVPVPGPSRAAQPAD